jgi:hypothetical protein
MLFSLILARRFHNGVGSPRISLSRGRLAPHCEVLRLDRLQLGRLEQHRENQEGGDGDDGDDTHPDDENAGELRRKINERMGGHRVLLERRWADDSCSPQGSPSAIGSRLQPLSAADPSRSPKRSRSPGPDALG